MFIRNAYKKNGCSYIINIIYIIIIIIINLIDIISKIVQINAQFIKNKIKSS